ncbi:MAG: ABC-F family ATP-binding cassette domain-containing protein [Proteobacteria bacterium]|nr:ABC-F family ATP-binding cassette domain-containing protein [Pseudomonadota bacterium]
MLHINDLVYRAGGKPLLDGATVSLGKGERAGLVGRNGSGKTTLLKLISGELQPDGGAIGVPRNLRIGTVAQHAPSGPESLIETVLAADRERGALLAEANEARDAARIAEIHERLAAIGAEAAPARAARILAGLGFDEAAQQGACAVLSGGWRMRVALAALLFSEPDLLLLDEPTNHLDLEATLWLEGYLKGYPGTLILVSHDRDLLNRIPHKIVHLERGKLTLYSGNYDRFERTRRERLAHQAALGARQQAQRRHIQAFVERFRYKASKARQAQSRIKALERMEPIASVMEARTMAFDFPAPKPLAPPLITLEGARAGYAPGADVLAGLNLRLDMDDRIALLGANGNGKSTFMKLLAGRLAPQGGRLVKSTKLKIGYFAQDQAEELDLAATPLLLLARALPDANETRLRAQLGRFGFGHDHAELEVGRLSGGERARLLLALMSREAPQVLLLDEPSNHLDVDSREALVQALNAYPGAVVLVSHDPHLIGLVADRLWLVADGTVVPFDGDLDDYRRYLQEQRRAARTRSRGAKAAARDDAATMSRPISRPISRKNKRRLDAEARAAVAHLRKAAKQAEARVEALGKKKAELEARLADPEVYGGPTAKLQALQVRFGALRQSIAEAEEAWLAAQAALEDGAARPEASD